MSQLNVLHVCGDAGVNKPAALPACARTAHTATYSTHHLVIRAGLCIYDASCRSFRVYSSYLYNRMPCQAGSTLC